MRAAIFVLLALQLGCAGSLYTKGNGDAVFPVAFGSAEFISGDGYSCASGGPISEGLASLLGDSIRFALALVIPGSASVEAADPEQERQAGCLERAAE